MMCAGGLRLWNCHRTLAGFKVLLNRTECGATLRQKRRKWSALPVTLSVLAATGLAVDPEHRPTESARCGKTVRLLMGPNA